MYCAALKKSTNCGKLWRTLTISLDSSMSRSRVQAVEDTGCYRHRDSKADYQTCSHLLIEHLGSTLSLIIRFSEIQQYFKVINIYHFYYTHSGIPLLFFPSPALFPSPLQFSPPGVLLQEYFEFLHCCSFCAFF